MAANLYDAQEPGAYLGAFDAAPPAPPAPVVATTSGTFQVANTPSTGRKIITRYFRALANVADDVKECADLAFLDYLPQYTTKLPQWFNQFGLRDPGALTDAEKRAKLDGAWKATGSLASRYLQDTLRAQGFDVYVHEWWEPGTELPVNTPGCVSPRNPLLYLQQGEGGEVPGAECGEALMECGEAFAECGNTAQGEGYVLVTQNVKTEPDYLALCGEASAECGEAFASCGNYIDFNEIRQNYIIPDDPAKWPFFVYIGAQNFPDLAAIPGARRTEFEDLLLKYCPAHLWIGVLAAYN